MSLISVLAILLFTQSCQRPEILTQEEVLATISRFDDGWKNKDSIKVDEVLSPSYIYFTQSGGVFSRKSIIQTAYSKEYQLQQMEREDFVIKLRGNTAIVSTIWKGKGTYRGRAFNDRQRCSITLVKNNGKVEILSEHCTPVTGPLSMTNNP